METTEILQVGTSINIRRTDGRVHSAMVASVNYEMRTATVEWFEQGETKGKEVDMAAIEALNPDVRILKPGESYIQEPPIMNQSSLNKLQRNPTRQSIATTINNKSSNGSMCSTRATRRATQFQRNGQAAPTENIPQISKELGSSKISINNPQQNAKRSNVVKEVEKLKKNREERRQRQAEEKAEKEAFLQMAPGNPHWELLNMIQEYRRGLDIKPLTEHDAIEDHLITVCVRKRPVNKKEAARKEVDVITIPSKNQLIVHEPKNKVDLTKYLENQLFRFDYAFDETCTNDIVYKYTAQPLIKTIFEGGFATCFAYGQTGSGKTHTMGGDFNGKNQDCQKGIYAMAAGDVFRYANSAKYRHLNLVVSSSFFEIYSGKVFDLLNNKLKLRILEDGKQQVQVVGLTEKVVTSVEEVLKLIQKGNQARTSGQTSANSNSSRSHAVFQIILRSHISMQKIHGKFSLIDLAGNERGADTSSANRQTRMEGAEINKSLLALKECIRALGRKGAHLPFRVSKLTQVLRDSFVGPNSRTCMIAMISPGVSSCEHSLNTLRYADRVKELGGGDLLISQGDDGFNSDKHDDGDLMHLRSLSENDMTPELLNFHQVISELQAAEDNMLDNHKQTIDQLHATAHRAERILRMADDVTYDQEAYCKAWEELLDNTVTYIVRAQEIVTDYKAKLATEEQLSRKTKRK
ncbi:Kinesin [Oryctes borbonicus]|uniref:Kinesin-like protein n=1 Tax=Oryctes borbonicus TaxID=1629725 RepID=A0A0T6AUU9_9SCAR|nr:Kinesin [Oryctes borbonicus]